MVSIAQAARRVKHDPGAVLSRSCINAACERAGHRFRRRTLDPFLTIVAMITQVMHGHTSIAHVVRLMHGAFTESAFCQARTRLPLAVLTTLLHELARGVRGMLDDDATPGRWRGLRTLLIDGTGFSMPDTPALAAHFGYPSHQRPGCGFPIGHLAAVFDAATGLVLDLIATTRRTGELTLAAGLRAWMRAGDLLVGDAQFDSYAHLAVLHEAGMHGLFRLRGFRVDHAWNDRSRRRRRSNGNLVPEPVLVRRLSADDRVVEWVRPDRRASWQTRDEHERLPRTMRVRLIRVRVESPAFRTREVFLVTTLLDPTLYPADEIAALYLKRWAIEVNFRHLKRTMGMEVLRCQSVEGVQKEIAAFVLAYNLARLVMLDAAARQRVEPERISFVDALRWMCGAAPDEPVPKLKVNPRRPERFEPRLVKRRRHRPYPPLRWPRADAKRYYLAKHAGLI